MPCLRYAPLRSEMSECCKRKVSDHSVITIRQQATRQEVSRYVYA